MKTALRFALIILCLLFLNEIFAQADGVIDSAWAINGHVFHGSDTTDEEVLDMVLQPDQKILACGYTQLDSVRRQALVFRMNENGSIDTSFAQSGFFVTSFQDNIEARAIKVDSISGDILICAHKENLGVGSSVVFKLDASGKVDSTFSSNGYYEYSPIANNVCDTRDLWIQSDNSILIVGEIGDTSDLNFWIYKLSADGIPDSSFGTNSQVEVDIRNNDGANCLVVDQSQIISIGGYSFDQQFGFPPISSGAIVQLNQSGSLVQSFGSNGRALLSPSSPVFIDHFITSIASLQNGKLIVLGHTRNGQFVARLMIMGSFLPDGSFDQSFGHSGWVLGPGGPVNEIVFGTEVRIDNGGRIYMSGFGGAAGNEKIRVVRRSQIGFTDSTFNTIGHHDISFLDSTVTCNSMLLLPNQRVLLVGGGMNSSSRDALFVRLHRSLASSIQELGFQDYDITVFPNPSESESFYVSNHYSSSIGIEAYSIDGKKLWSANCMANSEVKVSLDKISEPAVILVIYDETTGEFIKTETLLLNKK